MAMKQLRRDNTGAGPRRCRSPPIVRTVVEGERRSPGSSSWRSSIRELPSLSQAGTGSRTMAPRGWRQRRKALWSGEAIVRNFEARKNPTALQNQVFVRYGRGYWDDSWNCWSSLWIGSVVDVRLSL